MLTQFGLCVAEIVGGDRGAVVLVGHSYSGMVITGVAERAADRVAAISRRGRPAVAPSSIG